MSPVKPIYVPALKWKAGEQAALTNLHPKVSAQITPLIELLPTEPPSQSREQRLSGEARREARPLDERVDSDLRKLAQIWRERPFYLDPRLPAHRANSCAIMMQAFDLARAEKLRPIPVISLGVTPFCIKEAGAIHKLDGRGAAIRIPLTRPSRNYRLDISAIRAATEVFAGQADVILDALDVTVTRRHAWLIAQLASSIDAIRASCKPRNLIVLGGSMPVSLAPHGYGRIALQRQEWTLYSAFRRSLNPIYVYGDYVIDAPRYSPGGQAGAPNIRYTADRQVVIYRDVPETIEINGKPHSKEYRLHALSAELKADPIWRGDDYSAGEKFIDAVAKFQESPATGWRWREAGTATHITYLVEQLANLASPAASALRFS